jgi:hypothetical protein
VPGDRLALAIRVGREDQLVGAFQRLDDLGDLLGAAPLDLPEHLEVVLGIDRAVLGGQVADMPERGHDLIVRAQILVDRLGLGRRLDDEELHGAFQSQKGRRTGPGKAQGKHFMCLPGEAWRGAR